VKALTRETAQLLKPIPVGETDRLELAITADSRYFLARLYRDEQSYDGSAIETYPSHRAIQLSTRIPERQRHAGSGVGEHWKFGASDMTVEIINECWPQKQLVFRDEETRLLFQYLLFSKRRQDLNAENVAHFKEHGLLPLHDFALHPNMPLARYQELGLVNSADNEGYALFMEQGTGKTAIVVSRICNEAKRLREGRVDEQAYQQSVASIQAKAEASIKELETETWERLKQSLDRKENKLKNAAMKLAASRTVSLSFEGAAAELLLKAQRVVAEVNALLARRQYEIIEELNQLRVEATSLAKQRLEAEIVRIKANTELQISRLKQRRVPGEQRPYLAIVVCPKQLRFNWEAEFHKFATEQGRLTRIAGSELRRTKQLIDAIDTDPNDLYSVVIISYDSLGRTQGLDRIPWDLAVLDESHFIKNSGTQRWKAARKLRDRAKQRMVLTGTPITNTVLDLYTQFEFLGEGSSGFTTATGFRQFYGVFDDRNRETGFAKLVGVQNLPFMRERLARLSLIIKKSEVLKDLPDKQYDVYEVEMSEEQAKLYAVVQEAVIAEIKDELDESKNREMSVNNILTKMLRLAQVTSGFAVYDAVYNESGDCLREKMVDRLDPNPKIETLVEILKEKERKDKTIVWATFVQDIKSISGRLHVEGIDSVVFYGATKDSDREDAVRRFNEDPKCKVFIGNPAAGGTGLNLLGYPPGHPHEDLYDTNANHVIYFSQNWSMPARAQSEDRCHRRGTREPVRITDLMIPETIDEVIRQRVTSKIDIANSVADVRELLKNIFKRPF